MKNYIIPQGDRDQIVTTLEGLVITAAQGAVLIQIAAYLRGLKEEIHPLEQSQEKKKVD